MSLQCYLHAMGIQTWRLKQVSTPDIKLMLIGQPLTDPARLLLNAMLQSIGYTEEEVLMTHEIQNIAQIKPAVIVILGETATHVRGKIYSHENIPTVATYHPRHLLAHPSDKRKAYEDLRKIVELT